MGLDMYASSTPEKVEKVDFDKPENSTEIAYWRKVNNLHGWMERLYRKSGGTVPDLNVVGLRLDLEDLDQLESDLTNGINLEPTEGFFGRQEELSSYNKETIYDFIDKARRDIEAGLSVFYWAGY